MLIQAQTVHHKDNEIFRAVRHLFLAALITNMQIFTPGRVVLKGRSLDARYHCRLCSADAIPCSATQFLYLLSTLHMPKCLSPKALLTDSEPLHT